MRKVHAIRGHLREDVAKAVENDHLVLGSYHYKEGVVENPSEFSYILT